MQPFTLLDVHSHSKIWTVDKFLEWSIWIISNNFMLLLLVFPYVFIYLMQWINPILCTQWSMELVNQQFFVENKSGQLIGCCLPCMYFLLPTISYPVSTVRIMLCSFESFIEVLNPFLNEWALTISQIFYFIMFLSTVGTTKLNDPRDSWHSGWWSAKILMLIALMVLPFFVPSAFIQFYGEFTWSVFQVCKLSIFWG